MKAILLDTCILIDFLRNKPEAVTFLESLDQIPYLSAMTVAELYGGVREGDERKMLDQLIETFRIVPVNRAIAAKGGLYRREYHKSHGVGLVDAVIAATGKSFDASIVTLNKKHFPMIPDIVVPYGNISSTD